MKLSLRVRLIGAVVGAVILIFICSLVAARLVLQHDLFALGSAEVTGQASAFDGYVASREERTRLLIAQEASSDTVSSALATRNAAALTPLLTETADTGGLSFLAAADMSGHVISRSISSTGATPGGNLNGLPLFSSATLGQSLASVTLVPVSFLQGENLALQVHGQTNGLAILAAAPISDRQQRTIGVLYGGVLLNHYYDVVDEASRAIGGSAALLEGDTIVSSSIDAPDGTRVVDVRVANADSVLRTSQPYTGGDTQGGTTYLARIDPITDAAGQVVGATWYGLPMSQITTIIAHTTQALVFWGILAVILVSALAIPIVQALSNTLVQHSRRVRATAKELGVLIVGAEVSDDHVIATKRAVESSGAVIREMAASGPDQAKVDRLRALNSELENDVTVIETLTEEVSKRMQEAVDRVAELNEVAAGLNEIVTGESGN